MNKKKNYLRVPYGLSVHGKDEIKAVENVLKNSTQMGVNVFSFEKKVSKLFNITINKIHIEIVSIKYLGVCIILEIL